MTTTTRNSLPAATAQARPSSPLALRPPVHAAAPSPATEAAHPHPGPPARRLAALAACALLATLACGGAGVRAAAPDTASARPDPGSARAGHAKATGAGAGGPAAEKKRSLADELFTEAEREAWRQKIAAAPDEAQKRQLRGQRLAELQRRSREAKAAAGGGKPAPREAR